MKDSLTAKIVTCISVLLLTGCAKQPIAEMMTDNQEFQLARLFTHEGCSVYRFYDNGSYRYYTDCRGSASWEESCGKNCRRDIEVETSR